MGVYSQSFLPAVGKTTAHVLDQTRINVPFRVGVVSGTGYTTSKLNSAGVSRLRSLSPKLTEAHNGR
jgi:hypothetical protein